MRRLMADILGSSTERGAIVLVRVPHLPTERLRYARARRSRAAPPTHVCLQAAAAKMFVGDLVERARERMTATGEEGPIQPTHLRWSNGQ